MDKARQKTDKMLNKMKSEIGRVYEKSPALLAVEKKYYKYMAMVQKRTEESYKAYINATDKDEKDKAKQVYIDQIKQYTSDSDEYNALIKKIVQVLAKVNQQALDIVNSKTKEIYCINYNQVAEDCKRAGIKVNGEE